MSGSASVPSPQLPYSTLHLHATLMNSGLWLPQPGSRHSREGWSEEKSCHGNEPLQVTRRRNPGLHSPCRLRLTCCWFPCTIVCAPLLVWLFRSPDSIDFTVADLQVQGSCSAQPSSDKHAQMVCIAGLNSPQALHPSEACISGSSPLAGCGLDLGCCVLDTAVFYTPVKSCLSTSPRSRAESVSVSRLSDANLQPRKPK